MSKNKKEQKKIDSKAMQKAKNIGSLKSSATDPQGSYTGVARNPYEKPVQDADDL